MMTEFKKVNYKYYLKNIAIFIFVVIMIFTGCVSSNSDEKATNTENVEKPNVQKVSPANKFISGNMHTSRIKTLAFSNDGKYLVSGSEDKSIQIWNTDSKSVLHCFDTYGSIIYSLDFIRDSLSFISGSTSYGEPSLKLWDMAGNGIFFDGGTPLQDNRFVKYDDITDTIITAGDELKIWNLDGNILKSFPSEGYDPYNCLDIANGFAVSGSLSGKLTITNMQQQTLIKKLDGHDKEILVVQFNPTGDRLISIDADGFMILWDTETWQILVKKLINKGSFSSNIPLTFNSSGNFFALGCQNSVYLYNFPDLTIAKKISKCGFDALAFHPKKDIIAMADSADLLFYDIKTDKTVFHSEQQIEGITQIIPVEEKGILLSIHNNWTHRSPIKVWDMKSKTLIGTLGQKYSFYNNVSIINDNQLIACGSRDVEIWDIDTYQLLKTKSFTNKDYYSFACSKSAKYLAAVKHYSNQIDILDASTLEPLFTLTASGEIGYGARMIFDNSGSRLIAGDNENFYVFDMDSRQETDVITAASIYDIAISNDDRYLCIILRVDGAFLYDLEEKEEIYSFDSNYKNYKTSFLGEDNRSIYIGNFENTIERWNIETEKLEIVLPLHTACVSTINKYENIMVSGSWDGTVKLWDAETGTQIASFMAIGDNDYVTTLADGSYLMSKGIKEAK